MTDKIHFTAVERLSAAIAMAIAFLGLVNWAAWQWALFGLSQKQMAIISFVPLMLIVFYLSPTDRVSKVRDE